MNEKQLSALLNAQQSVIEKIALTGTLEESLTIICEAIETIIGSPEAKSSILRLEGSQLWHGAAPSLPTNYCTAVNGVTIGPNVGSCGTAAFTQKQTIVSDIEHDPLWEDYKSLALNAGLKACWSTPIMSSNNDVLGSFAIYYSTVKSPDNYHLDLIERFTHLSGLAIEKERASQREKTLNAQLLQSNEKFKAFNSVLPDLGIIVDEQGMYIDIYGTHSELLYEQPKNMIGKLITDILPTDISHLVMSVIDKTIASNTIQTFEYELEVIKGRRIFEGRASRVEHYLPELPEKKHALLMLRDITERKIAEKHIEQLAFFDPLTSLPNRRLLTDRLQATIEKVTRSELVGALLFLDLDDFKRINDSLGHTVGDKLLVNVAHRLKPVLRVSDTIARIGGDEFVVILEALAHDREVIGNEASSIATRLIHSLESPLALEGAEYKIGASIGICLIEGNNITADEILKRADTAMYRAKNLGGNQFSFYDPALQDIADQRLKIERDIIAAITEKQFTAYFQPQMNSEGNLIGAEALIRWIHPEKGIISPLDFIPIAEQAGLIDQLQNIVLTDICELFQKIDAHQPTNTHFSIAINISARQFRTHTLCKNLCQTLDAFDVSPQRLMLEITESMLVDNMDDTIKQMKELREKGFRFSIDDFGTGYSSLAYLQSFPVNELKIDQSFVNNMHEGKGGTAIIDAIISLANHLDFDVIAEGVETQKQADIISNNPIKGMQGYFFAKPMPSDDFIRWIR